MVFEYVWKVVMYLNLSTFLLHDNFRSPAPIPLKHKWQLNSLKDNHLKQKS